MVSVIEKSNITLPCAKLKRALLRQLSARLKAVSLYRHSVQYIGKEIIEWVFRNRSLKRKFVTEMFQRMLPCNANFVTRKRHVENDGGDWEKMDTPKREIYLHPDDCNRGNKLTWQLKPILTSYLFCLSSLEQFVQTERRCLLSTGSVAAVCVPSRIDFLYIPTHCYNKLNVHYTHCTRSSIWYTIWYQKTG